MGYFAKKVGRKMEKVGRKHLSLQKRLGENSKFKKDGKQTENFGNPLSGFAN